MTDLIHGIEVLEVEGGVRPISTVRTSVIGLVGTAARGPVNVPTLITGAKDAVAQFGLGGSIAAGLEAIYAQTGALIIALNVLNPAIPAHVTVVAAEALGADNVAGAIVPLANSSLIAFTQLVQDPGGADTVLVDGVDYTVDLDLGQITLLKALGAAAIAADYTAANFAGVTEAEVAGVLLQKTGVYGLINAEALTGFVPKILIAPEFAHFEADLSAATAIVPALVTVADRLGGVCFIDSLDTDKADAITLANLVAGDRARVGFVDPSVTSPDGARSGSAYVAGVQAMVDNEKGFWWSCSNQPINGIVGTGRPIDFALGDPSSEAEALNAQHIITIINKGGLRTWGSRSLETVDPKWKFLCVRRTADMINESILRGHLWAVDRPINKTYVDEVMAGVKAYLRHLVAQGAILGGTVWVDEELNTPESIALGHVWFDFDFTPTYPAEKVTFRSHLVNGYVTSIFS
jgi:phage tail sheath protein FI